MGVPVMTPGGGKKADFKGKAKAALKKKVAIALLPYLPHTAIAVIVALAIFAVVGSIAGGPSNNAEVSTVAQMQKSGSSDSDVLAIRGSAIPNKVPWQYLAAVQKEGQKSKDAPVGHTLKGFVSCKIYPDDPENFILSNLKSVEDLSPIDLSKGQRVPSSGDVCPKPQRAPFEVDENGYIIESDAAGTKAPNDETEAGDAPVGRTPDDLAPLPEDLQGGSCPVGDQKVAPDGTYGCIPAWEVVKGVGPYGIPENIKTYNPDAWKVIKGVDPEMYGDIEEMSRVIAPAITKLITGKAGYAGVESFTNEAVMLDDGMTVDVTAQPYLERKALFMATTNMLPIPHVVDYKFPKSVWLAKIGDFIPDPYMDADTVAESVTNTAQSWALGRTLGAQGCSVGATYNGDAVAGLTIGQTANANAILQAARQKGLSDAAGIIGIAVALTETSLYNLANDGSSTDVTTFADGRRQLNSAERAVAKESLTFPNEGVGHNFDSIGLFQQRPSAGWGDPATLMNPTLSAGLFFDRLVKVSGWETMDPAMAAQTVQRSAFSDGGNYRSKYELAVQIVGALGGDTSGATSPDMNGSTGVVAFGCTDAGGYLSVIVDGVNVTIPNQKDVPPYLRGKTITVANEKLAQAIAAGFSYLGSPYVWGGGRNVMGPSSGCDNIGATNCNSNEVGFDCSGLTGFVMRMYGVTIPSDSAGQRRAGRSVPWSSGLPGDIIGYNGHVSLYLGEIDGVKYQLEAADFGIPVRIKELFRTDFDPVLHRYWE